MGLLRHSPGAWSGRCIAAVGICLALAGKGVAQSAEESNLKAAFLYNFVTFVEWPENAFPDPESPILIGVLGDDPFRGALDRVVRGERLNQRPLQVRHFSQFSSEARDCHILYVGHADQRQAAQVLWRLRGAPVLTVSDTPGFARIGGVVELRVEGGYLRLDINPAAAREADLSVSSKLLRLATIVPGTVTP